MDIKPIRTRADYRAALKRIEGLIRARAGSPEGEHLDVLRTLLEAYERKRYPIDAPDPVEAIRFEMERKGLQPGDLEPMIGRTNRVTEVLARKRPLTLQMIWRLHRNLGIPAGCLIRPAAISGSPSAHAVARLGGSLKRLRGSSDRLMKQTRGEA